MAAKKPAKKATKKTPAKRALRAAKKVTKKATSGTKKSSPKRSPTKRTPIKKSSTGTRKQSAPKKIAPKKSSTKVSKRSRRPPPTAYEKRDANAREKGFDSYWDERQSRVAARQALKELGHPGPNGIDPATLAQVDQLALMGRGESAQDLFYETKALMEEYRGPVTDREVWQLIRVFYRKRR